MLDINYPLVGERAARHVVRAGETAMKTAVDSFALGIASFKSQVMGSFLTSASKSKTQETGLFADYFSAANAALSALPTSAPNANTALSPAGRNLALFDPESAYRMMTLINGKEALYKAQFSELSEMGSDVVEMQGIGQNLGGITTDTGNDGIRSQLQNFVEEYNAWVQRFTPATQSGGLLADTQAAQMSRWELDQSIDYMFFGAEYGLHGLADLGLTTDPATGQASLDTSKLDATLAGNKQGAVDAIQEFSARFAEAARLLNASGNFIPKQLDNLDRVIDFIADNRTSLTAEFGTGDPAKPTGQVAAALAAYNQVYNS